MAMSSSSPQVIIERAERLRLERPLNGMRLARLRGLRIRLGEPSAIVVDEPVIVVVKEKRKATIDAREVEWWDEMTVDHLDADVWRWRDLVDHAKAVQGYVTVFNGVLAYLMVFGFAQKSVVTGFLWAMSDLYPDFRSRHELVKYEEIYAGLKPEERITLTRVKLVEVEDIGRLGAAVGQELSRISKAKVAEAAKIIEPERYPPRRLERPPAKPPPE